MKLEDCRNCPGFIDSRADCVICKYGDEIEHRVISQNMVISCPRNE